MTDFNGELDTTINETTDDSTEQQDQANLEAESTESEEHYDDDGLTNAQRQFKEKRREENRQAREALKKLPQLEAELEFNRFLRKSPDAEDYEQEIKEFRVKNPTIGLDQAYKYVLADLNPARLAELQDSGLYSQKTQARTAPISGDKSFQEQIGEQPANDMATLKKQAEKEFAKMFG